MRCLYSGSILLEFFAVRMKRDSLETNEKRSACFIVREDIVEVRTQYWKNQPRSHVLRRSRGVHASSIVDVSIDFFLNKVPTARQVQGM